MNAQNAKEFLTLIQAMANGKTIQDNYPDGVWRNTSWIETIDNDASSYRIKPEPRTFEMWLDPDTGCVRTIEILNDTPETDSEANNGSLCVPAEFARKLERERNEALDNNYQITKMALEFRRELYAIKDARKTILELQKK